MAGTVTEDCAGGIAIIGAAGRFPGARNLDEYWNNLSRGVESVEFFSDDELRAAGQTPDTLADPRFVKAAPVLDGIDQFDASFFDCSPREARLTDPQHRLFLECAWEAMENAGYDPLNVAAPVGVYGGAGGLLSSYLLSLAEAGHPIVGPTGGLSHIANDKDFLTTRVSYKLNLTGPSINIQSACSTSLVAVHVACQGLLNHECDMALAGGVTVRVPQRSGYFYEEGGIVSPDGHCRAFDAAAQGTIFGSGVGIVLIKRLADALADGDRIRAIIKGTAINNDGGSKLSYTAASETGQAAAIAEALALAGFDPETVGLIEAHGTATALGDPVEVSALTKVFRNRTRKKGFCAIGSVKSNIGHCEAAAGIAGLLKTMLALEHRQMPASLHVRTPNPRIDFANGPFYVNTALSDWPEGTAPRRAGVNCVGIGGTNAFVALEEAPLVKHVGDEARPMQLFCLAAKTEPALVASTHNHVEHLDGHRDERLQDVCYTAAVGRSPFNERLAIVADSTVSLKEILAGMVDGGPAMHISRARALPGNEPKTAFLFPDQGWLRAGLGNHLFAIEPVFRQAVETCDRLATSLGLIGTSGQPSLLSAFDTDSRHSQAFDAAAWVAVATFAMEFGLLELWRSWGIEPAAVMGEALGEYVAGYAAGILSLEDALRLATMQYHNTPATGMRLVSPQVTFVSSVTGRVDQGELVSTAAYWTNQVPHGRGAVAGAEALRQLGFERLVVLGPSSSFPCSSFPYDRESTQNDGQCVCLPSLGDESDGMRPILESLGELWVHGAKIDWQKFYRNRSARRIALPTYPFQRERFWLDPTSPETTSAHAGQPDGKPRPHSRKPLVRRLPSPLKEIQFECKIGVALWGELADHRIYDRVLVPGAWHLATVLAAAREVIGPGDIKLADVVFPQALVLGEEELRTVQLIFTPAAEGDSFSFQVCSLKEGEHADWKPHARGRLAAGKNPDAHQSRVKAAPEVIELRCPKTLDLAEFYEQMRTRHIALGPAFQWNASVVCSDSEALSRSCRPVVETGEFPLHPGQIDACFQLPIAMLASTHVPLSIDTLVYSPAAGSASWCHAQFAQRDQADPELANAGVRLFDKAGRSILDVNGLSLKRADRSALLGLNAPMSIEPRFQKQQVAGLVHNQPKAETNDLLSVPTEGPIRLRIPVRGILDDLHVDYVERRQPVAGEVEIRVQAAGLNFRDVLNALGTYPGDPGELGLECAGVVSAVGQGVTELRLGDEVVAIALGSFSSHVTTPAVLVRRKPVGISFQEAATLPVAFLTAHYAFNHLGRLTTGQRVLIHAAAGGVGLAAVQLAQAAGAEIFATAGSPEKRAYLRSLGIAHVMSSRTAEFEGSVLQETNGRGVDFVLNSLSGDLIRSGLAVLAPGGNFVELGKIGIWDQQRVAAFRSDVSYSTLALDTMFRECPELVGSLLGELTDGLASGRLRPLPSRVYPLTGALRAFRFMSQARHIGKLVLSIPTAAGGTHEQPCAVQPAQQPRRHVPQPEPAGEVAGDTLRDRLRCQVQNHAARVLGLDASQMCDCQRPLTDFGLDSMMAVELINALAKSTGHRVPSDLVFNRPTVEMLTDYLAKQSAGTQERTEAVSVLKLEVPAPTRAPAFTRIARMFSMIKANRP